MHLTSLKCSHRSSPTDYPIAQNSPKIQIALIPNYKSNIVNDSYFVSQQINQNTLRNKIKLKKGGEKRVSGDAKATAAFKKDPKVYLAGQNISIPRTVEVGIASPGETLEGLTTKYFMLFIGHLPGEGWIFFVAWF